MSVYLKKAGPLIFSVCFLGTPAFAQQVEGDNGLYLRAAVGVAFGSDLDQSLENNPGISSQAAPPIGQVTEIGTSTTFGGALGFHYAGGTRTELEYRYLSASIDAINFSGETIGGTPAAIIDPPGDFRAHFLMSNFYKDFDNESAFTPYIGFGVGGAFFSNGFGESDSEFAYQGRAGVAFEVADGLTFDLEYNYLRTTALEFGPDFEEDINAAGFRATGDAYASSSILFSLRKEF